MTHDGELWTVEFGLWNTFQVLGKLRFSNKEEATEDTGSRKGFSRPDPGLELPSEEAAKSS